MDAKKSHLLAAELISKEVGGWTLQELLDNGKSAAVFRATKEGKTGAIKIFDPELIDKFELKTQLARVDRERQLIGHGCSNLIQIFDGGQCPATGHVYVVMELLAADEWKCLQGEIDKVPREAIGAIIRDVADAARWLEQNDLVHRDIKPSNIMVKADYSAAKLLDLGVLLPLAGSDLTNVTNGIPFIGTLQYSPPEFLLSQVDNSPAGWRSVTFYQIGAVMYDLLMRKHLFQEFAEPYGRMVLAIQFQQPEVAVSDVHPNLVTLCQCCLIKDWSLRLKTVEWPRFEIQSLSASGDSLEQIKTRVRDRVLASADGQNSTESTLAMEFRNKQLLESMLETVQGLIHRTCTTDVSIPRVTLHRVDASCKDTRALKIVFDHNQSKSSLKASISITMRLSIESYADSVVKISATRAIGEIGATSPAAEAEELFSGVFNSEAVGIALATFLYESIECGQLGYG